MKTYSNSETKNSNQSLSYVVIAICSLVILALAIILGVALANPNQSILPPVVETPEGGEQEEPSVNTGNTALQFVLPIDGATVIREASLDKLVYMPSLNMWRTHNGIDVSASENAPVKSIANGEVSKIEQTTLEGVVVTVTHENGLVSVYKSLASSSVKEGDEVSAGAQIGVAGTMLSENSDGVHLHLEIFENGKLVNPLSYLEIESNK
jgi:murein DD-endopeptidase MepM/ murein hydrolase activator NlpD